MARPKVEVSANQVRSIVSKYNKGAGLVALAAEFKYSVPVIRRVLAEAEVVIRGRGRPAAPPPAGAAAKAAPAPAKAAQ